MSCCLQLSLDLKELDSPEELHPLKDALERAKRRVDQSTGIREALEAEVHFALLQIAAEDISQCCLQSAAAWLIAKHMV